MVIRRVIIRVTPFKALITLLITYLLSPLGPLQVASVWGSGSVWGFGVWGLVLNHELAKPASKDNYGAVVSAFWASLWYETHNATL